MRKTLGVCLLTLLLTSSASAGIMQNGSPTPPPPQPASVEPEPTDGEQVGETPNDAPESLTQTVLDLLSLLPRLL